MAVQYIQRKLSQAVEVAVEHIARLVVRRRRLAFGRRSHNTVLAGVDTLAGQWAGTRTEGPVAETWRQVAGNTADLRNKQVARGPFVALHPCGTWEHRKATGTAAADSFNDFDKEKKKICHGGNRTCVPRFLMTIELQNLGWPALGR